MDTHTIVEAGDAEAVDALIAEIYGPDAPAEIAASSQAGAPAHLLHVAAVSAEVGEPWAVLCVGAGSPASIHDRFALELSRARADAIVVTGKILRDEPALRYLLAGGLDTLASGLLDWRRRRLGKREPPTVLVLTSGAQIDLGHPVFAPGGWARPLIYCALAYVEELVARAGQRELEVRIVGAPERALSLAGALAFLRADARIQARTIVLEAGPTTTAPCYAGSGPSVDELALSVFSGALDPASTLGAFVSPARARLRLRQLGEHCVVEPSGRWCLSRWVPTIDP